MREHPLKIFILGPAGSGKTTAAKKISSVVNIVATNLDDLFWINEKDEVNKKRSNEERTVLFNDVLKKDNWIIEGAYVEWPLQAMKEAEFIILMDIPSIILYKRILIRFLRRKTHIEKTNKKENLKSVRELMKWNRKQIDLINKRINNLEENGKTIIRVKKSNDLYKIISSMNKAKAF